MRYPFSNEPLTDFACAENASAFQASLDRVRAQLGRTYPLVIGGEKIYTPETFDSINPANPSQIVGRMSKATPELAARGSGRCVGYAERKPIRRPESRAGSAARRLRERVTTERVYSRAQVVAREP